MDRKTIALALLVCAWNLGCRAQVDLEKQQTALHLDFIKFQDQWVERIETTMNHYLVELVTAYMKLPKPCAYSLDDDQISSIYIPRQAELNTTFRCLMRAAKGLDDIWVNLYKSTDLISWIYLYDQNSAVFRIYPRTDTQAIYGGNLSFEAFTFFKSAIAKFPGYSWSDTRIDINGTGKIIIFSKAIKLPKAKRYTVIGLDLKPTQLIENFSERFIGFSQQHSLSHLFVLGYSGIKKQLPQAFELSSNPALLKTLIPFDGSGPKLPSAEQQALEQLELKAKNIPGHLIVEGQLFFNGQKNHCTMSHNAKLELYNLLCNHV